MNKSRLSRNRPSKTGDEMARFMRKFNITYIVNRFGRGGSEKQLGLLINRLKHKYNLSVICLGEKQASPSFENERSVPVHYMDINGSVLLPSNLYKILNLRYKYKEFKSDIIHSWLFQPNFVSAISKFFCPGVRLIVSKRGSNCWYKRRHFIINKFVYKICDSIIVNALTLKKEILQYSSVGDKIVFIPNGIDEFDENVELDQNHPLRQLKKSGKTIIGCVGRFVAEKRYFDVLKAAQKLLADFQDVHFILVGGRGQLGAYKILAEKLGIHRHVTFTGEVDNAIPYINLFDIYLLASSSEGMPNALMEAMMLGKPVVSTNVGAIPELIENEINGIAVPPFCPEILASAIKKLICNTDLRERFGENNSRKIKQFSIYKMALRMERIYSDLLKI